MSRSLAILAVAAVALFAVAPAADANGYGCGGNAAVIVQPSYAVQPAFVQQSFGFQSLTVGTSFGAASFFTPTNNVFLDANLGRRFGEFDVIGNGRFLERRRIRR